MGIEGKCAQSPQGLVCTTCQESISSQAQHVMDLLARGDLQNATELAENLKSRGLKLPGALGSLRKCTICSGIIDGQCDQTAKGLICLKCGDNIAAQVMKVKELFDAGDPMGAALISKKLKEQGITPPSIESLKHNAPSILRSAPYEKDGIPICGAGR